MIMRVTLSNSYPDLRCFQVSPNDLVIDGWDISGLDLASAMDRARVLEPDLKRQLEPTMRLMKPRKSIFDGSSNIK